MSKRKPYIVEARFEIPYWTNAKRFIGLLRAEARASGSERFNVRVSREPLPPVSEGAGLDMVAREVEVGAKARLSATVLPRYHD
jgi:hypothetical protein